MSESPASDIRISEFSQPLNYVVSSVVVLLVFGLLALIISLQEKLDHHIDSHAIKIEDLSQLPRGEYLKPALLGYQHLGADLLWLRLLQVWGKKQNTDNEYEWMYHTLDVITTLDPQYAYAYYVGGIALMNYESRADLSNRLLEKGHHANPGEWNLPFLLGHNHYFALGDAAKGAEYIGHAARTPGAPDFLSALATRMYAESENPDVALEFLDALWRENPDVVAREKLEVRAKEVMIERDIRLLESASYQYREKHGRYPTTLSQLAISGYLASLPQEPFGGVYELDPKTGKIRSSTHPERLKVFRLDKKGQI